MLLSIVECSDYRRYSKNKKNNLNCKRVHDCVEVIGPVGGPNVAAMRNTGARAARGKWIFFKDEDCEVNFDKVISAIQKIQNNSKKIGVISGTYMSTESGHFSRVYNSIQRKWVLRGVSRSSLSGMFHLGGHLLGGAMLVLKEACEDVGGFNEIIGWGSEDLDFTNRLKKKGYEVGVCFNLKVKHNNKLNLRGFVKRAWRQNFNRSYYFTNQLFDGERSVYSYLQTPPANLPLVVLFFLVGKIAFIVGDLGGRMRRNFGQVS